MTKLYGVIGDPIAHSLSPLIHRGWMREHKLDTDYHPLQIADGELEQGLDTLARRGVRGLNVTLPHKEGALAFAETVTPRAKAIGAANTLWRPGDGTWHADNTDAPGFLATLAGLIDAPLKGQRVLIIGAGGAARAVVNALHTEGVSIILANRTLSRAEALISGYQNKDQPTGSGPAHEAVSLESGFKLCEQADFVINTSSLGYHGQHLNLPRSDGKLLYDISYGKAAAPILDQAHRSGWRTQDGLGMLVYQAAFSFERWFGIMPDTSSAMERVRRTLDAIQ